MSNINSFPIPTSPFNATTLGVPGLADNNTFTGSNTFTGNVDLTNATVIGEFLNVAELMADTDLTYTPSQISTVTAGNIIRTRAGGFAYEVAASGASNQHITTAGGVKLYYLPFGHINVLALGAKGNNTNDDTTAILKAVEIAEIKGGTIYLPAGTYRTTAQITVDRVGVSIVGDASLSTSIVGDFTTDNTAVVRFQRGTWGIFTITLDATTARKTSGNVGYGLRVEPADITPTPSVSAGRWDDVRIINQPTHGAMFIGTLQNSSGGRLLVQNNLGHGAIIASGEHLSRTYTSQPGLMTFEMFWALGNGGHAFSVGHPDEVDGKFPYRIVFNNFEADGNAQTGGARHTADQVYCVGDNHEFNFSAFGGLNETGAMFLQGKDFYINRPRFIQVTSPAVTVGHSSSFTSVGIVIDRPRVVASATQNPMIDVAAGATNVEVRVDNIGGISTPMTPNVTRNVVAFNNRENVQKNFQANTFVSFQFVMEDDTATHLQFSGLSTGMAVFSSDSLDRGGLVSFRAGSSPFCNKGAGSAALVATTGVLTGTTGVDGNVTVATHTDNRLYIENRIGSTRTISVTLMNIAPALNTVSAA